MRCNIQWSLNETKPTKRSNACHMAWTLGCCFSIATIGASILLLIEHIPKRHEHVTENGAVECVNNCNEWYLRTRRSMAIAALTVFVWTCIVVLNYTGPRTRWRTFARNKESNAKFHMPFSALPALFYIFSMQMAMYGMLDVFDVWGRSLWWLKGYYVIIMGAACIFLVIVTYAFGFWLLTFLTAGWIYRRTDTRTDTSKYHPINLRILDAIARLICTFLWSLSLWTTIYVISLVQDGLAGGQTGTWKHRVTWHFYVAGTLFFSKCFVILPAAFHFMTRDYLQQALWYDADAYGRDSDTWMFKRLMIHILLCIIGAVYYMFNASAYMTTRYVHHAWHSISDGKRALCTLGLALYWSASVFTIPTFCLWFKRRSDQEFEEILNNPVQRRTQSVSPEMP